MARMAVIGFTLLVCLIGINSAPQFGGSFSQANAQAGAFGGPYQQGGYGSQGGFGRGFQGPHGPPGPPGYRPGFGGPGLLGGRFNNGGGSISISKSISISRGGGGGGAQSSAQSSATGK